ncbi:MAG: DUF262 domain-containing HNH endonuclease family protein [Proteobacteria bacterium]|nr:DUF262 domain-containing HNH endonuclease family protein [Pseudomonadota bacterium]
MSYASATIGSVLDDVNRSHFLPAIQRPYVWTSDQVVTLFDSLMKGYPISSFMFWDLDEETKREVRIYRFLEDYRHGRQNDAASPNGRKVVLVLDGQQRLTSLLIGLRGTFAEKSKHARVSNPDAWTQKVLYLDLFKDPEGEADEGETELGVSYGLRFHGTPPRSDHRQHWFKLGRILDYPDAAGLDRLVAEELDRIHRGATQYERDLAETALRRLHATIWGEALVNYYTEKNQSVERVLDIFVRANDGGTKLSKPDLLMSLIVSKWPEGSAREAIFGFVEHLNKGLALPNTVTRDLVLKACLVLCDQDVKYSVANFTAEVIATIEARWSEIKRALENTFRLINSFGISGEALTSLNAVLPIAYYLFRMPEFTFRGSTEFERVNADEIRRWLIQSLLVGAFAGSSDRTIAQARATIREGLRNDRSFPASALYRALATNGRISQLDERAIAELLELQYGRSKTFLALSLLYDGLDWSAGGYQVDHIIPQARAARSVLLGMNIPESRIREITASVDRLGNLQLLPATENTEKSALPFDAWITGRGRDFRARHLIPDRLDLACAPTLPEFVREREKLIRARLMGCATGAEA